MKQASEHPQLAEVERLVEQSILDLGIPPCPAILTQFMAEIARDEPNYRLLESLIGSDVSISAGLIKTANSSYFGLHKRVRSGAEALVVLGLRTTSQAIAGIILRKSFHNVPNLERFWDSSARISHLSGHLTQFLQIPGLSAEDACTYGLFSNCGIPVLLGRFQNYRAILEKANREPNVSFTDIEDMDMPTNHAMVGCLLAQNWWLPEEICLAIRNHHELQALDVNNTKLPLVSRRMIATSQLAEHLLQKQFGLCQTMEWEKLGEACLNLLEITRERLDSIYLDAASLLNDT